MHKLIITLTLFAALVVHAAPATPKTATSAIPSNTASTVTSVAIGDAYTYARDIDAVKFTVTGKTETNVVIVAIIGQPIAGYTNTVTTQSFDEDGTLLVFPRNFIATNCVERFSTDVATLSCRFVWATNLTLATTLTNAVSISATITTK
jgi:hypothetical protein